MSSTKTPPSHSRELCLVLVDRYDLHPDTVQEQVEFTPSRLSLPALDDHCRFQKVRCRQKPGGIGIDRPRDRRCFILAEQHRNERGAVEDDQDGSPHPSYPRISSARLRIVWSRRTRSNRSSAALRTAVVTVSPVTEASSRTDFSVAGSLIFSAKCHLGRKFLQLKVSRAQRGARAFSNSRHTGSTETAGILPARRLEAWQLTPPLSHRSCRPSRGRSSAAGSARAAAPRIRGPWPGPAAPRSRSYRR